MKKVINKEDKNNILFLIIISVLVLVLFLLFEIRITSDNLGFPLDDVYIHFQFSKNVAEGKGFSFNPMNPTSGSTSPAWTLMLSIFFIVIKDHLLIAKVLSAVFYILSGIASYFLSKKILKSKGQALIFSILFLLCGRFAWAALSGMEVTFFTFLLILFLLFYIKDKNKYLIVSIIGLASVVRPEGYLMFGFYVLNELVGEIRSWKSVKHFISSLILPNIIYLIFILPYLIFSFKVTGSFLPNTFNAQDAVGAFAFYSRLKIAAIYLLRYIYLLVLDNPLLTLLLPLGLFFVAKRCVKNYKYLLLVLISIGYPLIASVTAPNLRHHGRYIIPFIPVYFIIGICGIKEFLYKVRMNRKAIFVSIISTFIYLIIMLVNWGSTFGLNVKNINDMHINIGNWVNENIPEDSVIALNDIGAITYISQREIIDMVGLVSPEVLEVTEGLSKKEREEPLWDYLISQKPDYLIILPYWYPEISKKEELKEIYRVKLDRYTIVDGEMVVYKVNY